MNPVDLMMSGLISGRFAAYVVAAYGISAAGLTTLTVWTLVRGAAWKRRADRAVRRRKPQ